MVGAEAALSRYIRILLDMAGTAEAAADVASQWRPQVRATPVVPFHHGLPSGAAASPRRWTLAAARSPR